MAKVSVIIVDDSLVMRDLIAQIVRAQPDMTVVASVGVQRNEPRTEY